MRTADEIKSLLLIARAKPDPDYGGNVFPAAKIYSGLSSNSELKAFEQALDQLLSDDDANVRNWARNLCVGFVVFRDAIDWPKFNIN